jgi:methyltransferase (TIGR00027 family)
MPMRDGSPSLTAQRVAAHRLSFERLEAPFGDPDADRRLAADVAAGVSEAARRTSGEPNERMVRYLRGRTAFFDRVVINALGRGVTQMLSIGAGYDGRALRYAKDPVSWFEVDHPDTQRDKRERLERLGIEAPQITFVATDLREPGLATALIECGYEADTPALISCEGLIVYLDRPALETMLDELRAVVTTGTRLAFSASTDRSPARERFRESAALAGEPARNSLHGDQLAELLASARWRTVDISERSRRAGFWVAAPDWAATRRPAAPATMSRIGQFMERLHHRDSLDELPGHLERTYGIEVESMSQLDSGVLKIARRDGVDWVARVFTASRGEAAAHGDAEILAWLAGAGFPAERLAHPQPLSTLASQTVLVTEHLPGRQPARNADTLEQLGRLLARLHALTADDAAAPPALVRPGGAWHHIALQGGPRDELDGAAVLVRAAEHRVGADERSLHRELLEGVETADDCRELPHALIHPDFVPVNAIAGPDGELSLVDWAGSGRGPRLWSLAFLLWAAGPGGAAAVASGYGSLLDLEPSELERLDTAIAARPLVFNAWGFATGERTVSEAVESAAGVRSRAGKIATRTRAALHRRAAER